MPRTRLRKKSEESLKLRSSNINDENTDNTHVFMIKQFEIEFKERKKELENEYKESVVKINKIFMKVELMIKESNFSKILQQLREENTTSFASAISLCNSVIGNSKYNSSDEGYLTESLESRVPKNVLKTTIKNEALMNSVLKSHNTTTNYADIQSASFKTPAIINNGMNPALTFGYITPKIKPNKPMTVLRRPKQGELVISMSGSPLLVTSVVTEEKPNINIPLRDGRIVSVQPHAGMRLSEIPEIDNEIKTDLEILQKNLNVFMRK